MRGSAELIAALILASTVLAFMSYMAVQWINMRNSMAKMIEYSKVRIQLNGLAYSCILDNETHTFTCESSFNKVMARPLGAYFVLDTDGNGLWDYICTSNVSEANGTLNVTLTEICYNGTSTANITSLKWYSSKLYLVFASQSYVVEVPLLCEKVAEGVLGCGFVIG